MTWTVCQGDARKIPLKDETVQCVVTSPPFWGLRDYSLLPSVWGGEEHEHEWGENVPNERRAPRTDAIEVIGSSDGAVGRRPRTATPKTQFCPCSAWLGVLGLEPDPDLYIEHMVEIFREVRRVMRPDATCWINLGDSYSGSGKGRNADGTHQEGGKQGTNRGTIEGHLTKTNGLKPKDLCGIPWRVALALQADGWWLRSDIIWSKPNPMPESVTDRPTRSHEYVFLLTKAANYYYGADAVREETIERSVKMPDGWATHEGGHGSVHREEREKGRSDNTVVSGRNLRSVWNIPTQPFPEAHFATFPQALVEPCIKAGTSEKGCCAECGSPWERVVEKSSENRSNAALAGNENLQGKGHVSSQVRGNHDIRNGPTSTSTTLGWQPTCKCLVGKTENGLTAPVTSRVRPNTQPCLVLDPFAGSGTVGVVCLKLNRSFVGIELKADYCKMANKRVFNSGSLFG